ncbi:MAG: CPBP family intramembrane metalloprotease [Clostridium sp.]|jgi:membrane protease YdiL (CAAX protease family)|nr:CPBP family intramembrane metalloprotease [Clostridium sp.]
MDNHSIEAQGQFDIKKPRVWQVGFLYSLVVILLVFVSTKLQEALQFNIGGLLSEVLLVMLPPLVFLFIFRFDVKKVLRLNKTSFINFALTFGIMIFGIPIVGVFNFINILIAKLLFGTVETTQIPIGSDIAGLLIGMLVIAVSAGICEEVLFRGVIQRGFERFGSIKSILITAVLFGIMHFSFQSLFGTFLLGALIGFLVYKSDSLIIGMFAHFTNNAVAVILNWVSIKMFEYFEKMGVESIKDPTGQDMFSQFQGISITELVVTIAVSLAIITFSTAVFGTLMYGFIKHNSKNVEKVREDQVRVSAKEFLPLIPGLLIVAFVCVNK